MQFNHFDSHTLIYGIYSALIVLSLTNNIVCVPVSMFGDILHLVPPLALTFRESIRLHHVEKDVHNLKEDASGSSFIRIFGLIVRWRKFKFQTIRNVCG